MNCTCGFHLFQKIHVCFYIVATRHHSSVEDKWFIAKSSLNQCHNSVGLTSADRAPDGPLRPVFSGIWGPWCQLGAVGPRQGCWLKCGQEQSGARRTCLGDGGCVDTEMRILLCCSVGALWGPWRCALTARRCWPPAPLRKRAFSLPLQNTHEKATTPPCPDTMSRACLRVSERVGGKEPCLLWQHSNVSERCHCALTSRHSKHFLTFLRNKALSQWQGQVRGHPALPAPPPGHPRGAERGPQSGRPDARLCCFSAFSILVSLQVPQGRPQTLTGKLRDPRGSGLAFLI